MQRRYWLYLFAGLAFAGSVSVLRVTIAGGLSFFVLTAVSVAVFAWIVEFYGVPSRRAANRGKAVGPSRLPRGFGRAVLEQIPAPVVILSRNGLVLYANPAAFRSYTRLSEGDHYASLFRAPDFVEAVAQVLNERAMREVSFSLHQETERYFEAQISPLADVGDFGGEARALILIIDRSAQRLTEMKRRDFVANASHELRTPLASIIGFVETLQGHAKEDAAARAEFTEIIGKQAVRMQRLVDDLLALSRIEMSEHDAPGDVVDLASLAMEATGEFGPAAESHGIDLKHNLAARKLEVTGDRDQLYQVLANLIDNAIKYGHKGDEVIVSSASPDPSFPGMAGISVVDSGPGIAREHLHRLTERFYRVSVENSRDKGGTGLGLAIVKHILNRHRGDLVIRSKPGRGSRFTIWLPVSRASPHSKVKVT